MQLLVLGMHRSGTSAVSRLINLMGAQIGPIELLGRPADDNAKGFWERSDVRDVNDALLAARGANWRQPLPMLEISTLAATEQERREIARVLFDVDVHRPWVLKDPRLCLTLPLWNELLEAPIAITPLRDPREIAASLQARDGLPMALGLALAEAHWVALLAATQSMPRAAVSYSALMQQPQTTVESLHGQLVAMGASGLRMPAAAEVEGFLSADLRHHAWAERSEWRQHPAVVLYDQLASLPPEQWPVVALSAESRDVLEWNQRVLQDTAERTAEEVASAELQERLEADAAAVTAAQLRVEALETELLRLHDLQAATSQASDARADALEQDCAARLEAVQADIAVIARERDVALQSAAELRLELSAAKRTKESLQSELADQRQTGQRLQSELAAQRQSAQRLELELADQCQTGQDLQSELAAQLQNVANLRTQLVDAQQSLNRAEFRRAALCERNQQIVSLLDSLQAQVLADVRQLSRWLEDALVLMRSTFHSRRWRIGHASIRPIEILALRGRPRLAKDDLEQIERYFRAWWHSRHEQSAVIQQLSRLAFSDAVAPLVSEASLPSSVVAPVLSALPPSVPVASRAPGQQDWILFPVIDWHFRIQRPQHMARELGQLGDRVFYLSARPVTSAAVLGYEVFESPSKNVWLLRLHLTLADVPDLYRDRLEGAALDQYREALGMFCRDYGVAAPFNIVDLPFWRPLAESIPGSSLIYDCMDYHAGFSTNTSGMLEEEDRLIESADLVVVTSAWLEREVGKNRPVSVVRNGAETRNFSTPVAQPKRLSERPVIGYIGAISDWFDVELLAKAAKALPEFDFVMVGDVTAKSVAAASRLSNVRFVGEVPYAEAASYVQAFDVCLIPFQIIPLTLATNPVKAYEYLAAGKPVVATAMPELEPMREVLHVADDAEAFIKAIRTACDEREDAELAQKRMRWASAHDWNSRAAAFRRAALALLPRASVVVLTWNNLDYTKACLESLEKHTLYPAWELILVDNASTDGSRDYLSEYAATRPHVKLLLNDENLGFAAGNNVGLTESTGDLVVILNNDTYVTPGWLHGLVGHLRRNPTLGIVGPVTNNIGNEARIDIHYGSMEEMLVEADAWVRRHPRQLLPSRVVAFFCCALPRELLVEVGLLDEDFGQGFFEDDDYCNRIREAGREVAIAEDVFVHHHLSASFSTLNQERRQELFERNKAIYERKWGAWVPHEHRKAKAV